MNSDTDLHGLGKKCWLSRLKKKLSGPFSRLKHRRNVSNIAVGAFHSDPNLSGLQYQQGSGNLSGSSEALDQLHLRQPQTENQGESGTGSAVGQEPSAGDLETGVEGQGPIQGPEGIVGTEPASTQLSAESQNPDMSDSKKDKTTSYVKLTGTILEKGLFTLKEFAGLIPVPALEPAIKAVCGCIEHYHKISDNKEKLERLTTNLVYRMKALERHSKQDISPEMNVLLQKLSDELKEISDDIENKLQDKSKLGRLQRFADPDTISEETDNQFKAIQTAFDNCNANVMYLVEGKISNVLAVRA
ncbi:hypothetical protein VKT23_017678 [Stygiomarasmius scandens]|uniref:Uncharacterized protein n=1 Tax=Marasmiellus scandens TaxID=2682957 RepID=A0ABR1IRN0_9AGAR